MVLLGKWRQSTLKTKPQKMIAWVLTIPILVSLFFQSSLVSAGTNPVWAWGLNANGQLGYSFSLFNTDPVQVTDLNDVVAVNAGLNHGDRD